MDATPPLFRLAVRPLKVLLVLFFAGLVMGQTLSFPGQFRYLAEQEPDLAWARWPLTAWAFLLLGSVQVVIVCTWRLLDMIRDDRIFSDDSFRWVDWIIGALAYAWLNFAGMSLLLASQADDPGPVVVLFGITLAGAVFLLTVVVMRTLLRQATTLRTDMEAVI